MMREPHSIRLSDQPPVSRDAGVVDREIEIGGIRWAIGEYGVGSVRKR
jgi:hypothetical protein